MSEPLLDAIGETIRDHEQAMLTAMAELVSRFGDDAKQMMDARLSMLPKPSSPPIQVIVDMTPVADAIDRMTKAIAKTQHAEPGSMAPFVEAVDRLTQMVEEQTKALAAKPERSKREVKVYKDGDGNWAGTVKDS